jgi:hypothetical protein
MGIFSKQKDKKLRPTLKWAFNFDEEIPELTLEESKPKKDPKTKIEIIKLKKYGRDTSTNNPGLF